MARCGGVMEGHADMATLQFAIDIASPPPAVWDLITNLRQYDVWLPPSRAFRTVVQLNSGPVKAGTAYMDGGPSLTFHGEVTHLEPHTRVVFYQASRSKLWAFNVGMDVEIEYALQPTSIGTHVERTLTLDTSGLFTLGQPMIRRAIRQENERILACMKAHLEGAPLASRTV